MGEYATCGGQRVKIGTCEDMYYLRAEQTRAIGEYEFGPEVLAAVRFRFPWPDEDGTPPGGFDDPFRGLKLWGFELPEIEHGLVQFSAQNGYLVSLPCPEGPTTDQPYTVGRNGYGGPASLTQQAWRGGRLVGIAQCNGCGHAFRLEDGAEDLAAVCIRSQADDQIRTADQNGTDGNREIGGRFHLIADRLLAGYAEKLTP